MKNKQIIKGNDFYYMLREAFTSLSFNESYLNYINAFPVSDSDTGTNMKRTLGKGINAINDKITAGEMLHILAENMSLGSRGNSGFILSQYFKGLSESLSDKDYFTLDDFKKAIVHAYKVAYVSVINPTEGTILTVMKEGAERTLKSINIIEDCTFLSFFSLFSQNVFESVLETKNVMKLLKSNNVVDSGALGFFLVFDGMKHYFDENASYFNCNDCVLLPKRLVEYETSLTFFRYCTEFIISIKEKHSKKFFTNILKGRGDSIVIALHDDLLKVHIHTNEPYFIINLFKTFGSLVSSKIDDLFITNEFQRLKRRKHVDYVVVAFTYGNQCATLFESLGVDAAFPIPNDLIATKEGIETLLVPFLNENLIIFCVDKKIKQLIKDFSSKYKNILIIESNGMASTFYKIAFSMFDGTFNDFKSQIHLLNKIKASEFYLYNDESIEEQLHIYLSKNRLNRFSSLSVFGGKGVIEEIKDKIMNYLSQFDEIEVNYFDSGQEMPYILVGAL